jgi:hypothetical protein
VFELLVPNVELCGLLLLLLLLANVLTTDERSERMSSELFWIAAGTACDTDCKSGPKLLAFGLAPIDASNDAKSVTSREAVFVDGVDGDTLGTEGEVGTVAVGAVVVVGVGGEESNTEALMDRAKG